jgi:hypothetical protein
VERVVAGDDWFAVVAMVAVFGEDVRTVKIAELADRAKYALERSEMERVLLHALLAETVHSFSIAVGDDSVLAAGVP